MNVKQKGGLLALCGVTIMSFDSLLVKLVDTTSWNLIFWRGLLLSFSLLLLSRFKSNKQARTHLSPKILLGGAAFSVSTIFFVLALHNTQVTSALVIFNTAPFFAAVIAFIALKEKLPMHTLIAMMVAIGGIVFIFDYAPAGSDGLTGDVFAIISAIGCATYLVTLRSAPNENGANFLIVAGFIMASVALFNGAQPLSIKGVHLIYMGILGCLIVPLSGLLIAQSTKYLPAAQTGLILLLETLLGPLFVYIVLNEQPSVENMLGGGLVVGTLIAHTCWEARALKQSHQIQAEAHP
jgi:drug/metabolite transporter (DMT)-like permease